MKPNTSAPVYNEWSKLPDQQRWSDSMEKQSQLHVFLFLYFLYERHTQNVRHKRMERRNTDEKKLLQNNIIQTDFKAKKLTRDQRTRALMIEEKQQENGVI